MLKFLTRVESDLCKTVALLTLLYWAFLEMKTNDFTPLSVLGAVIGLYVVHRAYTHKS